MQNGTAGILRLQTVLQLQGLKYIDVAHLINGTDVQKTRDVSIYLFYAFTLRFEKTVSSNEKV